MSTMDIIIRFLEAGALGALIGLEREVVRKKHESEIQGDQVIFGGLRSHAFLALLGALAVFLGEIVGETEFLIIFIGSIVFLLILLSYIYTAFRHNHAGVTSELAAIMTFFLGVLVMFSHLQIAIFLGITTATILNFKSRIATVLHTIREEEIATTLKFAVIALVILPLLPNEKYALHTLLSILPDTNFMQLAFFNPYSIWLFVVFMSAVNYVGYILTKIFGSHKGIIFSGAIGGLVSSTAVTSAMAEKSKTDSEYLYPTVIATVTACSIMLLRILGIVAAFNPALLKTIFIPVVTMIVVSSAFLYWLWNKTQACTPGIQLQKFEESPFRLTPALKFAGFVICIKFFSVIAVAYQETFVSAMTFAVQAVPALSGILLHLPTFLLACFSGLANVDAITQQMAELSRESESGLLLSNFTASMAILLALATNTAVKIGIARKFGSPHFGSYIFRILGGVLLVGVGTLAFVH